MTDDNRTLARAWAMLTGAERDVIEEGLYGSDRTYLDKLAEDWIEELRAEKAKTTKGRTKP